jgi:chromosome segregation ATPase
MSRKFEPQHHVVALPAKTVECYTELKKLVEAKQAKEAVGELAIVDNNVLSLRAVTAGRLKELVPLIEKSADTVVYYRGAIETAENARDKLRDAMVTHRDALNTAKQNLAQAELKLVETGEPLHKAEVKLHEEKKIKGWKGKSEITEQRKQLQKLYNVFQPLEAAYYAAHATHKTVKENHDAADAKYKQSEEKLKGLQDYSTTVDATHRSLELIKSTWRKLGNVVEDFHDKAGLFGRELNRVDGKGSEEMRVKGQFTELAELWDQLTGLLQKGSTAESGFVYYCSKGGSGMNPGMFPAGAGSTGLLCGECLKQCC